ncbi:CcoQ/FixQ family Cbb3-type cytochrome c oxidase assembly chaperone [Acuticoccus kandeliae]|uniref:CcoQ/FixQ family Cbb3-type cytochrome c oxidase assembly chaperone n=1 Tax=Acuticoccus kandeliae TaxID=2073160 RepID=UPI000D3ED6C5
MDYHGLRAFADTWGLGLLAILFVGVLLFVFRRGSSERYRRAARIALDSPEHPTDGLRSPAATPAPDASGRNGPSRPETKDGQ